MLKKITVIDRIRNKIRELMGYRQGTRFIEETEPYRKKYSEIELANIANIEYKLKKALEENIKQGKNVKGIDEKEAEEFIRWIIERDREILEKGSKEERGLKDDSLFGCCGLSQGIVTTFLQRAGLQPQILNVAETIRGKGHGTHSFNTVTIPIRDESGQISEKGYLIDVTVRQFFTREELSMSDRFVKDKRFGNKVAPIAGYWCINIPGGKQFAHNMLRDGFVELTPENAKIYGDSFTLAGLRDEEYKSMYKEGTTIPISTTKNIETGISGEQYIKWYRDDNRKQEGGIDFYEGELEKLYGEDLMKSPLMIRQEQSRSVNEVPEKNKERTIKIEKEEVDK